MGKITGKIAGTTAKKITGKEIAGFAFGVVALIGLAIVTGTLADAQLATQFADGTPMMYAGVRG